MKHLILLAMLWCGHNGLAQPIFSETDLINVVRKFHPVARQAGLDINIADANLLISRGGFDPDASFNNSQKTYDGVTYYNRSNANLKIPLWYGVDITAGIESIQGDKLKPEETRGNLQYVGIAVPMVQNLLMDKRRAAVKQAAIAKDLSVVERRLVMNDLLKEALLAYYEWWEQYQVAGLVESALNTSRALFRMVKTSQQIGERPAIDTLEALSQVQYFEQLATEAYTSLVNRRLSLSTFLWNENEPYELPGSVVPAPTGDSETFQLDTLLTAISQHPGLQQYEYKLRVLQIDQQLKRQLMLPEVTLKYNYISKDVSRNFNSDYMQNNFRFGFAVSVPLRLSEGRGSVRAAGLKIERLALERADKSVQLERKIQQAFTEWQQLQVTVERQSQLYATFQALQRGEEIKFRNGESSLFLVNARAQKTIEAAQKLVSLKSKKMQAITKLKWSAALLSQP